MSVAPMIRVPIGLLLGNQAAMAGAASSYRIGAGLSGHDSQVPGWVAELEKQTSKTAEALRTAQAEIIAEATQGEGQ